MPPATPSTRAKKITAERTRQRNEVFPEFETEVWNRKGSVGFTTVPRILSLVCAIFKDLQFKGDPSGVYVDLWSRIFDEGFFIIKNEEDAAFSSGYRGQRAVRTWREHVKALSEYGFIHTAKRGNLESGFVLVVNPYTALARLRALGRIPDFSWNALRERCCEIGAGPELDQALLDAQALLQANQK